MEISYEPQSQRRGVQAPSPTGRLAKPFGVTYPPLKRDQDGDKAKWRLVCGAALND